MRKNELSRKKLLSYWKDPWDQDNNPVDYIQGDGRSKLLTEFIRRYSSKKDSVMEIGCNVGRNLEYIRNDGYKKLYGVEPSESAIELMKRVYPEISKKAKFYNEAIEDVIKSFDDKQFDVVFTMATLEHIHSDSEWVFAEMVRIVGKVLITIEDEVFDSWRHFPRDYQKVFEKLGMMQVEASNCLEVPGLNANFTIRVFKRKRGRPRKNK